MLALTQICNCSILDMRLEPCIWPMRWDVLLDSADYGAGLSQEASKSRREKKYSWVVDALSVAQKPLVLVGPALMRTAAFLEAQSYAKKTGVPILGMESPRGLNDPSLGTL